MTDDFYRDTDERYRRDPDFHAAVDLLEQLARQHGFTPGELKQIAFKAALNLEMRAVISNFAASDGIGRAVLEARTREPGKAKGE